MIQDNLRFCLLKSYDSLREALVDIFSTSSGQLKKYRIKKNILERPVVFQQEIEIPLDLANGHLIGPCYIGPTIQVLFENESMIVLNKPYDIHCHPLCYCETNNCLSFLRMNNFLGEEVNSSVHERGLLYRLDYVTSGVLMYIKRQEVYDHYRSQFHQLAKQKVYLAIVRGNCSLNGEFIHYLYPFGPKGERMHVSEMALPDANLGKIGITSLRYSHQHNVTLVKVSLYTGIRHQIRAQLAHLGYPILGDLLYGGEQERRVYLHAYRYQIDNYVAQAVEAPLFDNFFDLDGGL